MILNLIFLLGFYYVIRIAGIRILGNIADHASEVITGVYCTTDANSQGTCYKLMMQALKAQTGIV